MTFGTFLENLFHAQLIKLGQIRVIIDVPDLRIIEFHHDGGENVLKELGVEKYVEILHREKAVDLLPDLPRFYILCC